MSGCRLVSIWAITKDVELMPFPRASRALERFTVLDLTRVRAGPTCVRQLADWGANVIKIELPPEPGVADPLGGPREGSDFENLHRNKRSITLNLKLPEALAAFKRMVKKADVVVENFRPDVKRRLGVDYKQLARINPKLIYASISGFGQTGPYAHRPGFDQIAQGMGGLMSITGLPGQGPVRVGIPIADLTAGLFCALGILVALLERALTIDPHSFSARAVLALTLVARVLEQVTDTAALDLARGEELIEEVAAASPHHPNLNFARGQVFRARHQYARAIPEYEVAIALNRNSVNAMASLGLCQFFAGDIEKAIPAQELAIRLSPRDPRVPNWYWRIGMVHLLQSRTDEAISWIERARSANPRLAGPRAWLVSAYALRGDLERAAAELAEAGRLSGDKRYASITVHKAAGRLGAAANYALAEETFYAGLRKAGVPTD